jgi:hypothetical protein
MANTQQKIKNVIVKHYPELVHDGEVEMGTEQWFDLIIEANKIHGVTVTYKDLYNGTKPLSDDAYIELMVACEELAIETL